MKKFHRVTFLALICASVFSNANSQGLFTSPGSIPAYNPSANQQQAPVNPVYQNNGGPSNSPMQIEIAQRLLSRLGILNEPASGVLTQPTLRALETFASQNGFYFSGQVNESFLRSLRTVAWNSGAWRKGNLKGADKLLDASGIKEAQGYLVKLGFNPGPVDGTFGPQTQSSVESFQSSQKTSIDGMITSTTLMNLKRATTANSKQLNSTVRILNWPDYIDPSVLDEFERETKIRVIYDTYGSNEELESKLKGSSEPYDVVIPTASYISSLSSQGLLQQLNKSELKNISNLDPKIMAFMESWDPGSKFALPYMWYTIGIAYNQNLINKYAPGTRPDSLSLIFDPNIARKLASCGVRVVDSPSDVSPLAALYAGIKNFNGDVNSINAVDKVLSGVKGIVSPTASDEIINSLAKGKICVAISFSGDAMQAKAAQSAGNNIQYRVPVEGGSLGFDTLAISAKSKNVHNAHAFIDYVMRPRVIAKISNLVRYANGNLNSGPYLDPSLINEPAIIPPSDVMRRLIVVPPLSSNTNSSVEKVWKKFSN